jgi:hypothetical protein
MSMYQFVVLGDLHLTRANDDAFERARNQIRELDVGSIICLGDLGSGRESGTRNGFEAARSYLASFGPAYFSILGNHDLERVDQFASDAEVVACFGDVFDCERPYRTVELGAHLGILLSGTGFRDNRGYKHEISIDDEQFAWFRRTLEANRQRTTFVFTHAPPLGSHLRVLQYPHLRSGNAWLNQSDRPRRYLDLLVDHPQVRLWFSGHNHLGQHYPDSVSLVDRCLYVHTGVIGDQTRDGQHHSRLVRWGDLISGVDSVDPDDAFVTDGANDTNDSDDTREPNIQIDTVDHATGRVVCDVRFDLGANRITQATAETPDAADRFFSPQPFEESKSNPDSVVLGHSLFSNHRGMLVEYDRRLGDPIGVVDDWPGRSRVEIEGELVVLGGWFGRRRLRASRDGYYFQIPSRDPRLINEVREGLARRLGRRLW